MRHVIMQPHNVHTISERKHRRVGFVSWWWSTDISLITGSSGELYLEHLTTSWSFISHIFLITDSTFPPQKRRLKQEWATLGPRAGKSPLWSACGGLPVMRWCHQKETKWKIIWGTEKDYFKDSNGSLSILHFHSSFYCISAVKSSKDENCSA